MADTIYIVGDVHGMAQKLVDRVRKAKYSIALGDIGRYPIIEANLDPTRHRLLAGNHEMFDFIWSVPHFLGDFGTWEVPNFPSMFFIRGAWSIDRKFQRADDREELSYASCQEALNQYKIAKPTIMFTHDAPKEIVDHIGNPNAWSMFGWDEPQPCKTQELLQQCWEFHQPKLWFFGHHHKTWKMETETTVFHCLRELEVRELTPDLELKQIHLGNPGG
jgi:hypothetical protein